MNGDIKGGLALACIAVAMAVIGLSMRPDVEPTLGSTTAGDVSRALLGGAALLGVLGLLLVAKGLTRNSD